MERATVSVLSHLTWGNGYRNGIQHAGLECCEIFQSITLVERTEDYTPVHLYYLAALIILQTNIKGKRQKCRIRPVLTKRCQAVRLPPLRGELGIMDFFISMFHKLCFFHTLYSILPTLLRVRMDFIYVSSSYPPWATHLSNVLIDSRLPPSAQ
jgi:hypothetical protein